MMRVLYHKEHNEEDQGLSVCVYHRHRIATLPHFALVDGK
jgi:hypothetical protein